MNKISVIIPCYNAELYLSDCLNSVINQTYQNFEIIAVDDGSSDNTAIVLNQYQQRYADKMIVLSVSNKGASIARNLGLKIASGDFVQFLDADDLLVENKFENQLKGFEPGIDWVVSDRVYKNKDLTKVLNTFYFNEIEETPLETAVKKIIITCNPLYKRAPVLAVNGYNEQLKAAQDWDFNLRIVLAGFKVKYVPGVFLINRQISGSLSSDWVKVSIQATKVISNITTDLLQNQNMNEAIRQHFAQIHMNTAIYCENEALFQNLVQKVEFWARNNYTFIINPIKRAAVRFLGVRMVIRVLRMKKKIFSF